MQQVLGTRILPVSVRGEKGWYGADMGTNMRKRRLGCRAEVGWKVQIGMLTLTRSKSNISGRDTMSGRSNMLSFSEIAQAA